jgi:two-component system sensor histidine kinase KdpD
MAATGVLKLLGSHVNSTTVALCLLMIVLFVATRWGARPAVLASFVSMLCFNFFFLPPFGTFTIYAPDNWVALAAFLLIAIIAGHLSARAKQRAEEAEAGRREIERLYEELQGAFERASHAEALRQSERLKSALLDAVTHDIRTPLTSIKASATTLLEEERADDDNHETVTLGAEGRREMLEIIDEECDRLNRFVEGLVELARIEAGELQLRRRWGTIEEMISSALARAKKITSDHTVEVEIEKELPVVRVDARAVSEVIYTLVENAAKYSKPETMIRIIATGAADGFVQIAVEDQGRGVPRELRERVFDKFFRAMQEGDLSSPGTGMGLAIARGIVEAHGGRIWIEDKASKDGTRVALTLPIGDDEAPFEQSEQAVEATSQGLADRN